MSLIEVNMTQILIEEKILDDTIIAIGHLVQKLLKRHIHLDDGNTAPVVELINLSLKMIDIIQESNNQTLKMIWEQYDRLYESIEAETTYIPTPRPICAGTGVKRRKKPEIAKAS